MSNFFITFTAVLIMMCYAIPGFILVRTGQIKENAIPAFAKVLMYVCSPCLTIYTIANLDYSFDIVRDVIIVLVTSLAIQVLLLLVFRFIFRKRYDDVKYRIYTIATAMGNCGFMGVPLLEAVMPEHPEALVMSTAYCVGMNLIGWTVASAIISNDVKYMKVHKALLNPAVLSLVVAIPLFVTNTKLPSQVNGMVTLLGKMSLPMCMRIMGMRLATMEVKHLFTDRRQYFIIFIKQIIMPLIALGLFMLLPVAPYLKKTMFILSAAPVASVVLNFSEMIGEGQKTAANLVLLGTLLSVITIPILMLIP